VERVKLACMIGEFLLIVMVWEVNWSKFFNNLEKHSESAILSTLF